MLTWPLAIPYLDARFVGVVTVVSQGAVVHRAGFWTIFCLTKVVVVLVRFDAAPRHATG